MSRRYPCMAAMPREERIDAYRAYRINYLPTALDNARRKVRALEVEAARYGMTELLNPSTSLFAEVGRRHRQRRDLNGSPTFPGTSA